MKHKYISTPEDLQKMWEDYKAELPTDLLPTLSTKTGEIMYLPVQKPPTRWGFEAYVWKVYGHHVKQYLDNQDKLYNDYMGVVSYIRNDWTAEHVTGTMTGKYKAPNLTARVTGVYDNVDVTTKGEAITDIKVTIVQPDND